MKEGWGELKDLSNGCTLNGSLKAFLGLGTIEAVHSTTGVTNEGFMGKGKAVDCRQSRTQVPPVRVHFVARPREVQPVRALGIDGAIFCS